MHFRSQITVSLVGIHGAGKTTLAKALMNILGGRCFLLGDSLRQLASIDSSVQSILDSDGLISEKIVHQLLWKAITEAGDELLWLDGFPRHRAQLEYSKKKLQRWMVIHLDVNLKIARDRLAERVICGSCGEITRGQNMHSSCPNCGDINWTVRPEDNLKRIENRLRISERMLKELLKNTADIKKLRVNAEAPIEVVTEQVISMLKNDLINAEVIEK